MVLTPPEEALQTSKTSMTGATLSIPLSVQVEELKRAFPTLKRLGIISDPLRTKALADSAVQLCRKQGIEAQVGWAKGEEEVPHAVRALKDSIEVLWMIPDETVLTPRSSRFIIFELIKSGVPVIGLSSAYVKAGALMSLDCNYTDIGRQSAELAVRVLAGQKPGQLPFTIPRTYTRSLNLKILEHVRIHMDQAVLKDSNAVTF
jgi:putative ABC transport system substrate-binding protein